MKTRIVWLVFSPNWTHAEESSKSMWQKTVSPECGPLGQRAAKEAGDRWNGFKRHRLS